MVTPTTNPSAKSLRLLERTINNPKIPKEKKEHATRAMYLLYSDSVFFFPNVFNNIS